MSTIAAVESCTFAQVLSRSLPDSPVQLDDPLVPASMWRRGPTVGAPA
ncbi:hypothetical protein [Streptomyces inhibens]|nr:hypothetical protein [Streptomyces inhibens]